MWRRVAAEAAGTFLLTLSISASHFGMFKIPGTYYSAYAVAGSVVVLMVMTGYTSGAHFNPAVTLGHIIRSLIAQKINKSEILEYLIYILFQMLSAIPAAFLGWGLSRGSMFFDSGVDSSAAKAFFAELVYSTLIVGVALMLGRLADSVIIGTVAVGVAYFGGILAVGLISGGCFNPAVGLAVNLVHYSQHQTHSGNLWIYLVAPCIGGAIAGVLNNVFLDELKAQKRSRVEPDS
jgi:aquaporin Z